MQLTYKTIKLITKVKKLQKKYDIETENNHNFFANKTLVHNSNTSIYYDGELHVRSRSIWQKKEEINPYWYAVLHSNIPQFLQANPQYVVQGETIGIQGSNYRYELPPKTRSAIKVFDIKHVNGGYLDYDEYISLCTRYNLDTVDLLYRGLFSKDLFDLAIGSDYNCVREGIVIKPVKEKKTDKFERVIFKVVSPEFK